MANVANYDDVRKELTIWNNTSDRSREKYNRIYGYCYHIYEESVNGNFLVMMLI